MNELGVEKIDIIEWDEEPEQFVANALSPAKILSVGIEDEVATVKVDEDQLSLAIGKDGQNVRLAWKLTGFKIDIVGPDGKAPKLAEKVKEEEGKDKEEESLDVVEEVTEEIEEKVESEKKGEEKEDDNDKDDDHKEEEK
jgi:N utilization substance protein A